MLVTGPGQGALDRYGDREKRLTYRPADRASQDLHCCGVDAWASLMPPFPFVKGLLRGFPAHGLFFRDLPRSTRWVFYVVIPPTVGSFYVICLAQHGVV